MNKSVNSNQLNELIEHSLCLSIYKIQVSVLFYLIQYILTVNIKINAPDFVRNQFCL